MNYDSTFMESIGAASSVLDAREIRNRNLSHRTVLCVFLLELKLTALEEARETLRIQVSKVSPSDDVDVQYGVEQYLTQLQERVETLETDF